MPETSRRDERLRRFWDKHALPYDITMSTSERRCLAPSRPWLCGQPVGGPAPG